MSLAEKLLQSPHRQALIADAAQVLDAEVAGKAGLKGLAVKGAFKVVRGLHPSFVPQAIDALLDEFVGRVEPFYTQWQQNPQGVSCSAHFVAHSSQVADALLAITDERARHSTNRTLVKTYQKLRPMGKQHVEASMPRVGGLIEKHASAVS